MGGGRGNQIARGPLCHLITCEARRCPSPCLNRRSEYQGFIKVTQLEVKAQSMVNLFSLRPQFYLQPPTACHNSVYFMLKKKGTQGTAELCLVQE